MGDFASLNAAQILVDSHEHFPVIAEAIAEQKDRPAFKLYLQLAGRDIRSAIHACGQLARLYPADAADIAEVLLARQ